MSDNTANAIGLMAVAIIVGSIASCSVLRQPPSVKCVQAGGFWEVSFWSSHCQPRPTPTDTRGR